MSDNESFDKMANALDSNFVEDVNSSKENESVEVSAVENEIQTIQDKKNELAKTTKNNITLKDKEYIEDEIKGLITCSKSVLEKLEKDVKIGSSPRQYEVFATLANSITNQLKELRDLNKMIMDCEIMNDNLVPEEDKKKSVNFNVRMTGKDMLDFLDRVKEESHLKKVDAEFEVKDED